MEEKREYLSPKEFAQFWRNHPPAAESALWNELRDSKSGYKFSRQIRLGSYYVDFCCRQYKLVIEVDGEPHDRTPEDDAARDEALRARGYEVLRFSNDQVMERTNEVIAAIRAALEGMPRHRY